MADYYSIPPYISNAEKPSTMIIFDNSGSMFRFAYRERMVRRSWNTAGSDCTEALTGFDPSKNYYGYFDPSKYYVYDNTDDRFEVCTGTCSDSNTWSGNFLNWLTTRRIDVAKKVLTGGKILQNHPDTLQGEPYPDRDLRKVYDDSNAVVDINGQTRHMTPFHQRIYMYEDGSGPQMTIRPVTSIVSPGCSGYEEWIVDGNHVLFTGYVRVLVESEHLVNGTVEGLIQKSGAKIRFGVTVYDNDDNYHNGGEVRSYVGDSITNVINTINVIAPETWTPLAETLYTVAGYFEQTDENSHGPRYEGNDSYEISQTWDPYYFNDEGEYVPCSKGFVILITDGESTQDQNIPNWLHDYDGDNNDPYDYDPSSSQGSDFLDDVAYWVHTNDLRSDLEGTQNLTLYTIFAFGQGADLLREAAINGSFIDRNNDGRPNTETEENAASLDMKEWDFDGDGEPDNYAAAESGEEIAAAINSAIEDIMKRMSSGTAASVISTSRSGEGAVYQAVFFPKKLDRDGREVVWIGDLHTLFVDGKGNLREDSNYDKALELTSDKIVKIYFDTATNTARARLYTDANGDGEIDTPETPDEVVDLTDLDFVWDAGKWLANLNSVNQCSYDNTTSRNGRYIFTWVDIDNDGVVDSDETIPFTSTSIDSKLGNNAARYFWVGDVNDDGTIDDQDVDINGDSTIDINDLIPIVQFIRGEDQTSFRSRQIDYDDNGNVVTWRLGDIIHSTPSVVSRPAENYDLLYKDNSYREFKKKYQTRRIVVYAGANDGMLHAFNGGFYDSANHKFWRAYVDTDSDGNPDTYKDTDGAGNDLGPELGAELWAFVPYQLIPHLQWLARFDYSHVYYVDLKPKIFDARIFPDDSEHPNGWGTVLLCGMRFGGGEINIDTDGNPSTGSLTMRSAYYALDITNPESPPTVLWCFTNSDLGFATSYPAVTRVKTRWFVVIGSGPTNYDAIRDVNHYGGTNRTSKIFILDAYSGQLERTIDIDSHSFIADPVTVDLDLTTEIVSSQVAWRGDMIYVPTDGCGT